MFRHWSRKLFGKLNAQNVSYNFMLDNRNVSYASKEYNEERDPAPLFFSDEVQYLLTSLTRVNLSKVYRKRKLGDEKLEIPNYKFLTQDQLDSLLEDARKKAADILQIPPAVKIRKPIDEVINSDRALQGLDIAKFVFTDITFGVKSSDRLIVVREPNGTLSHADWKLRDRMNQVYFPVSGRKYKIPLMFQDYYFTNLLSKSEFEFILDRACIQFEPDDPEYQRVTSITYQYVNDNNGFELLRSTRHFGSLVFFLSWFNMIDNLLLELIETFYVDEASILLQLYGKIHNSVFELDEVKNIECYIKGFAKKRAPLELALQAYKDLDKQRKKLENNIQKAHGLI